MMNEKPKLLDSHVQKKIIKTLHKDPVDYWEPARTGMSHFYHKYIKGYIAFIVIILIIVIVLFYRYHMVKRRREYERLYGIPSGGSDVSRAIDYYPDSAPKYAYPVYPQDQRGTLIPNRKI